MSQQLPTSCSDIKFPAIDACYQANYCDLPIVKSFKSHGRWYGLDEFGVIHQLDAKPYTYDAAYVSTYDTEDYRRQSDILQAMRLGFTIAAHGGSISSLLDYGYGNGAFLKFIKDQVPNRWGYDLTGVEVDGCVTLSGDWEVAGRKRFEVITFWDALEHVPSLSFIRHLPCDTVVISLPWCHYDLYCGSWFDYEYKHRKPDEHLHHFDRKSLEAFMKYMGWRMVAISNHEDLVRKSPGDWPNILTMAFKR